MIKARLVRLRCAQPPMTYLMIACIRRAWNTEGYSQPAIGSIASWVSSSLPWTEPVGHKALSTYSSAVTWLTYIAHE